jgi:hypothetical protein
VLLLIAGVVLVLGHDDGVYFIVPGVFAVLVGGVVNAWLIPVRLTDARDDLNPFESEGKRSVALLAEAPPHTYPLRLSQRNAK